jgi:Peptidase A4 family
VKVRAWVTTALVTAAGLAAAPAAMANTTRSTNWAGYAAHRAGVSFHQVTGTWTQPNASCVPGQPGYSAVWVGLGGFNPASNALEQIGTEVDCTATGHVVSSAWYELVPAPSKTISFAVQPGDVMHAAVSVVGRRVVVELDNLTRHHSFQKTLYASSLDVSSAEWIVEAPSQCISQFACQALPLADFGSVTFASARATSAAGALGSILSRHWNRTRIKLTPGGQRFIVSRGTSDTTGTAAPSSLRSGGSEFNVTYATASVSPGQSFARRQSHLAAAYLQH